MRAAVDRVVGFDSVPKDAAAAVVALGCECGGGALDAVESGVASVSQRDGERFVVVISAGITYCHDTGVPGFVALRNKIYDRGFPAAELSRPGSPTNRTELRMVLVSVAACS